MTLLSMGSVAECCTLGGINMLITLEQTIIGNKVEQKQIEMEESVLTHGNQGFLIRFLMKLQDFVQ